MDRYYLRLVNSQRDPNFLRGLLSRRTQEATFRIYSFPPKVASIRPKSSLNLCAYYDMKQAILRPLSATAKSTKTARFDESRCCGFR